MNSSIGFEYIIAMSHNMNLIAAYVRLMHSSEEFRTFFKVKLQTLQSREEFLAKLTEIVDEA